jgi:hypothetical protein
MKIQLPPSSLAGLISLKPKHPWSEHIFKPIIIWYKEMRPFRRICNDRYAQTLFYKNGW